MFCVSVGPQPPPETVTTPLASVQEEKEETEWPQGEEHDRANEGQENGKTNNIILSYPILMLPLNH